MSFDVHTLQLCELLKIKEKVPYTLPTPVEAALEANEAAVMPIRKIIDKRMKSNDRLHTKVEQPSDESPPKLVQVPFGLPPLQISPSKQNKIITQPVELHGDDFEYVGKADSKDNSTLISKVRYEIPENSLSRTASLIIGNRKELEMHEFSSSKGSPHHISSGSASGRNRPTLPEIDPSGDRPSIDSIE